MKIWNLTPHTVHYDDGTIQRSIPSQGVIRLQQSDEPCAPIDGMNTVQTRYGGLEGVPKDIAPGDVVIVSTIVGDHWPLADRPAGIILLVPDTGPTCRRDADGRIVGVSRFIRK